MASKIEDYGFIGNCFTCALVSRTGSIDWLCAPRFDSDACFAALVGYDEHGRWALRPAVRVRETRSDLPAKNLRLRALRAAYVGALIDACQRLDVSPPAGAREHPETALQSDIYRMEAALRERGLDVRETAER